MLPQVPYSFEHRMHEWFAGMHAYFPLHRFRDASKKFEHLSCKSEPVLWRMNGTGVSCYAILCFILFHIVSCYCYFNLFHVCFFMSSHRSGSDRYWPMRRPEVCAIEISFEHSVQGSSPHGASQQRSATL